MRPRRRSSRQVNNKQTNVLVVGDISPAVLRPGSNVTGKARRAFELQEKGQDIEVMTEDDFLRCLEGKAIDGPDALLSNDDRGRGATASPPGRLRKVPLAERPKTQTAKAPAPFAERADRHNTDMLS